MKKILLIIIPILILFILIFSSILYKNNVFTIPFGNVKVSNEKYNFQISYLRKYGLNRIDKWDNGLPGNPKDMAVYGHTAKGFGAGPYTKSISLTIYNLSFDDYRKKYKDKYTFEEENFFDEIWYIPKSHPTKTHKCSGDYCAGFLPRTCTIITERQGLLYIIFSSDLDYSPVCGLNDFKFLN